MKKILMLSCALALAGLSNAALAADGSAGFIRGEIGDTEFKLSEGGFSDTENSTSYGFRGGYWFNANFAVEGAFTLLYNEDFGDSSFDVHSLGVGIVGKKNLGANNSGLFFGGRAGVARITAETRDDDLDVTSDDSATELYYGVNAGYDFSERFGLSLNYDIIKTDVEGIDVDIKTLSVGGEWRF